MYIYDAHCHLDAASLIDKSQKLAVASIQLTDIALLSEYRIKNNEAKIGVGLHPWHINPDNDINDIKIKLVEYVEKYKPDFIGECGLDFLKPYQGLQLEICKLHCEIAIKYNLPIVFHCVRAYNQLLQIITQFPTLRGMVHGFNSNREMAKQFAKKNISIGIGSLIMNVHSQITKSIANIPLEQILIESDSPYMPMQDNISSSPFDCMKFAEKIAEVKQKNLNDLINEVNSNWNKIFN